MCFQSQKDVTEQVCLGKDKMVSLKEEEIAAKQKALVETQQQLETQVEEYLALKDELRMKESEMETIKVGIIGMNRMCMCVGKTVELHVCLTTLMLLLLVTSYCY